MIAGACGLPRVLGEATAAFLAVLDRYALADLLDQRQGLRRLFGIEHRAELEAAAPAVKS